MPCTPARLAELIPARQAYFQQNYQTLQERGDPGGSITHALGVDYAVFAVAAWCVDGDADAFCEHMTSAAHCQVDLLERKADGEPIRPLLRDISCFPFMLYALAAGDRDLAQAIAAHPLPDVTDRQINHVGFVLKYLLLRQPDTARQVASAYPAAAGSLAKYERALDGILNQSPSFGDTLAQIDRAHLPTDAPESLLDLWGIGLANLYVIDVGHLEFDGNAIPSSLLLTR